MKTSIYDLIVIGAGSGGLVAAETAVKLGASVALIEKSDSLGGECLHTGCVPSKSLIHASRTIWSAKQNKYSTGADIICDFKKVKQHINQTRKHIERTHDNDDYFTQLGIDVFHGEVVLMDKETVSVNQQALKSKKIVIATGSSAFVPKIDGIEAINYLTNETVFDITELPQSLTVIGGGPIGCELGQAFAMLGSKVTILQSSDRLLPREEQYVSEILTKSMLDMGVSVITNANASKITKQADSISTFYKQNEEEKAISSSHLLIATGRQPNLPSGLDAAGVSVNKRGIVVDEKLRTSSKNIYAVGDCNGGVQFTHAAGEQAAKVVQHALYGFSSSNPAVNDIPWATFTTPEIAHIGHTTTSLESDKIAFKKLRTNYDHIDKPVTDNADGFIELLVTPKGTLLGATIVGENASEIINLLSFVKKHATVQDLSKTIFTYPTIGIALKQLAADFVIEEATTGFKGKLLQLLRRI